MRRGGDMHGRGGTEGSWESALAADTPTPTFHPAEVRQSVHSGRCANDHPAAGTRTGTSQRGGYLAAVNGGRAHTSFTSLHERAPRQLWNRDECRRTRKFIGTTRTSRVSTAWRESDGSPHAL